MRIKYLGHSAFQLFGNWSLVLDPFNNIGYDMENVSGDFVLCSHKHYDHNAFDRVHGAKLLTSKMPEADKLKLSEIVCFHDNNEGLKRGTNSAYIFELDGITFCHLGDVGEKYSNKFSKANNIDVLFIPVGGHYTIGALDALEYVEKFKPKIVIPMHFKTKKSNIQIASVDEFMKANSYKIEKVEVEIELCKKNLPVSTTIYLFDYNNY